MKKIICLIGLFAVEFIQASEQTTSYDQCKNYIQNVLANRLYEGKLLLFNAHPFSVVRDYSWPEDVHNEVVFPAIILTAAKIGNFSLDSNNKESDIESIKGSLQTLEACLFDVQNARTSIMHDRFIIRGTRIGSIHDFHQVDQERCWPSEGYRI